MITDEQIQKLKPGDPLIIHGTFNRIYEDGDICIEVKATAPFSDEVVTDSMYVHPSCVSMPTEKPIDMFHITKIPEVYPKYDPCRPFKVGDEVRYCAPDGRIYADRGSLIEHIKNRDFTKVVRDELPNGRVGVLDPFDEENPYYVPAHALELVTPVEELEPYKIAFDDVTQNWNVIKDGVVLCSYKGTKHPHAEEAAKAECARLNAEYRKEQQ